MKKLLRDIRSGWLPVRDWLPFFRGKKPIQRTPLSLISDLLFALHTARDVALLHSPETVITGNNLLNLLTNLMDHHPEPTVRHWVQEQLCNLNQGKQTW